MKPFDAGDFVPESDPAGQQAELLQTGKYVLDSFGQLQFAPVPSGSPSGAQLRKRLITPEVLAAIDEEEPERTLLQRLFRRK